jgi:hypothetical protein
VDQSEFLSRQDHDGDGKLDWGFCLDPNDSAVFNSFLAPILQTRGDQDGSGNNIFFDTDTFEPLVKNRGFRFAVDLWDRAIRASNCREQILSGGHKCDIRAAILSGRCAGVIATGDVLDIVLASMPSPGDTNRTDFNQSSEYIDMNITENVGVVSMPGSEVVYDYLSDDVSVGNSKCQ